MNQRTCSIPGCERKHRARGFCHNHYTLARRRGEFIGKPVYVPTLEERFFAKVDKDGPAGCWLWTASKDRDGYGHIGIGKNAVRLAHRVGYELIVGPIPDGLELDHLCRNPSCVNPRHLDPVTSKVNTHRGYSPASLNARKTHCINGHQFTPENTYLNKLGRACRQCQRDRNAAKKAARQRP